jgi:hypothetical protein
MSRWLIAGALAVALGANVVAQAPHNELVGLAAANAILSVDSQGETLRETLIAIAERVKVTVQFAESLTTTELDALNTRVDAVFKNATFHDVIDLILRRAELSATVVDRRTILIDRKVQQR